MLDAHGGIVVDMVGTMRTDDALAAIDRLEASTGRPGPDGQVEMVLSRPAPDRYRAAAADGIGHLPPDRRRRRLPLRACRRHRAATRSPTRPPTGSSATRAERDARFPAATANAYPHAFDSIAQFFDAPSTRPTWSRCTPSHHHVDAHLGQHGSLGVVQARAPFIAAGAGIAALGPVDRVHPHRPRRTDRRRAARPRPASPTASAPTGERDADARLRRQDGDVEVDLLDGERADHVVVFLLDGCNANLLHDVIDAGEAPHLAALAGPWHASTSTG